MMLRLGGQVTHETEDALGKIRVLDYRKHRVLTFDSVFEQSKIALGKPWLPVHEYNRAMLLPLVYAQPAHATVLGLGGGVMVNALHYLLPLCRIHAVELRAEVVNVAREFFGLPDHPTIDITVSDARPALREMTEGITDLILADLYGPDHMSPAQAHRRFIDYCHHALSDTGWLAMNFHVAPDRGGPLMGHLNRLFADVLLYRTRTNNYVLYASKQPVDLLLPTHPALKSLETRLPIGWRGIMERVYR